MALKKFKDFKKDEAAGEEKEPDEAADALKKPDPKDKDKDEKAPKKDKAKPKSSKDDEEDDEPKETSKVIINPPEKKTDAVAEELKFKNGYGDANDGMPGPVINKYGPSKMKTCTACSGSGYYDSHGSPPCGACGGTGKTRQKEEPVVKHTHEVYSTGGSIGRGIKAGSVSRHATKEEADEKAKRMNARLTPGEKSYYKMRYKVRPIKEEEVTEVAKEGYQRWPGQKKTPFRGPKTHSDDTKKWAEKRRAEREWEKVVADEKATDDERHRVKEETIAEVSRETLRGYISTAARDMSSRAHDMGWKRSSNVEKGKPILDRDDPEEAKYERKQGNRYTGVLRAARKLAKEEVELEEKASAATRIYRIERKIDSKMGKVGREIDKDLPPAEGNHRRWKRRLAHPRQARIEDLFNRKERAIAIANKMISREKSTKNLRKEEVEVSESLHPKQKKTDHYAAFYSHPDGSSKLKVIKLKGMKSPAEARRSAEAWAPKGHRLTDLSRLYETLMPFSEFVSQQLEEKASPKARANSLYRKIDKKIGKVNSEIDRDLPPATTHKAAAKRVAHPRYARIDDLRDRKGRVADIMLMAADKARERSSRNLRQNRLKEETIDEAKKMTPEEKAQAKARRDHQKKFQKERLAQYDAYDKSKYRKNIYNHGEAHVSASREGTVVYRSAYGPSKASVDAAHKDFHDNHPLKHIIGSQDHEAPQKLSNGTWVRKWHHWHENL